MRRAPLAVLLVLASPAAAASGSLSAKQFGSGGGYVHPSPEAGDYLENAPRRETPPPAERPASAPPRPVPAAAPVPVARAPRAAAPAPAPVPARAPETPAALPSLWSGLVRPLPASPADDESARAESAREYDGAAVAPSLAAGAFAPAEALRDAPAAGDARPGDALFVSIELDPGESGTLRDAVAGLGAAGFAPDARFEPRSAPGGASIVTGWLPASRLGDAVLRQGVRRVSVETSPRPPSRPPEAEGSFILGLRVADPSRPYSSVEPALTALARDAGLRGRRVLGLETAPDGRVVAVVSGRLPLSRLSKALAHADVVKLAPAAAPGLPAAPAPSSPTPSGFARFMAKRGLWLVLLTLAVGLLPPARAGLGRGLKALVPYH